MAVALEDELLGITLVARENLIAAVTGQQVGDAMIQRKPRAAIRWYRGRVAERLVVGACDDRNQLDDIVRPDLVFGGLAAEARVGDARVAELIVFGKTEADGERPGRRSRRLSGEHSGDCRAVEAAAQKGSRGGIRMRRIHAGCQRGVQVVFQ